MHSTRAQKGEGGIVTASCHPWHLVGAGSGGGVLPAAYKKMILRVHTRAHAEGGMAMFLGNVNIEEPAWLMGLQQNELFARFAFKALVS